MSRIAEIRHTLEDYRTAGLITGVLQEISATKMQDLRGHFERNARFFTGIREVYAIVKEHAAAAAPIPKEQKDIYIGLTSNKRFSGTLNRDVVRSFVAVTRNAQGSDFLMLGVTGAQYVQETDMAGKVESAAFEGDSPTPRELATLLTKLNGYGHVYVVYPKFINPFRQDIVMTDVTEMPAESITEELRAEYIFEPEITGMIDFFESQVRHAIFERVLLETDLAQTAARTMRMRDAKDRAEGLQRVSARALMRENETVADIQLMETFIGFTLWRNSGHVRA